MTTYTLYLGIKSPHLSCKKMHETKQLYQQAPFTVSLTLSHHKNVVIHYKIYFAEDQGSKPVHISVLRRSIKVEAAALPSPVTWLAVHACLRPPSLPSSKSQVFWSQW